MYCGGSWAQHYGTFFLKGLIQLAAQDTLIQGKG